MGFQDIFFIILYQPILNLFVFFYQLLWSNFGLAVIAITLLVKIVTIPLTKPGLEMAKKQKELAPEIKKLKEKYTNKQVFAQKQMELYKKHGVNPAAGCLPTIIQLAVFIVLYKVFIAFLSSNGVISSDIINGLYPIEFLKFDEGEMLNSQFLIYNLSAVDKTYTLPILSAVAQFFLSKLTLKSTKVSGEIAKSTPDTKDDIMYNMQEGMIYTFPLMTFFIGITLPSGLSLYWLVSTIVSLVQYLLLNKSSLKTNTIKSLLYGSKSNPN